MTDDSASPAILHIADGVASLTFNRPDRLNAVNADMHRALREAFDRIEADDNVGALILTGAGRGFCAGQDLAERAGMLSQGDVDLEQSLRANYNPLVSRLVALPFPTIAAVNGVAAGAGAALAIACDIVLAARSARFQFAFTRVGLGPDTGASSLLPRLIGQGRALALALTAEPIDAEEAQRIGLAWKLVDDEALASTAASLARGFADGPRSSLAATGRMIRDAAHLSFDEALTAEAVAQGRLGRSSDYREAVSAFMAKRPPKFGSTDS